MHSGTVPPAQDLLAHASADLPLAVLEHLPVAQANATKNVEAANGAYRAVLLNSAALLNSSVSYTTPKPSRVMMLRHVASQWSEALEPFTACRKHCTHCCHIAVAVPQTEAKLIAKAIGVRLKEPLHQRTLEEGPDTSKSYGYHSPCVFLKSGKCSIYAHRPLACRTLVNMDDTELLCELQPQHQVPVPYGNAMEIQARFAAVCESDLFADIRDWFRD